MILYYTHSSPFARKVRILALELDLMDSIESMETHPFEETNELPMINPLRKVPALLLEKPIAKLGRLIVDSPVICGYLRERAKSPEPATSTEHLVQNTLEAISDGILDVAVSRTLEKRRPPGYQIPAILNRHQENLYRTLDWLETRPGLFQAFSPKNLSMGVITLGCALDYLDFRHPDLNWKENRPQLQALQSRLQERSSFQRTLLTD